MALLTKVLDYWLENSAVKADATRRLYQNSRTSQFGGFALAILSGLAILKTSVLPSNVYLWLGFILTAYLVSGLLSSYYKHNHQDKKQVNWLNRFRISTIMTGLAWASSVMLLFQSGDQLNHSIILLTLTGVVAAAALTYSFDYIVLFGFSAPIQLALFSRLVIEDSYTSFIMSIMIALFFIFMLVIIRRANKEYVKNITVANNALLSEIREKNYSHIMEMIANSHAVETILDEIVLSLEKQDPKMLCSILLLDTENKHLNVVTAPSLPDFYNEAIDGVSIGIAVGSCGTAAFTGNRIIAEDILSNHNWVNYKELATKANLRSCWSEPIKDSTGKIMGTFAIYHHEPSVPSEKDIQVIIQNASLAGIAIELARNSQEQRLAALFYQNSTESMMITDGNNIIVAVNPAFTVDTGYNTEEVIGKNPAFLMSDRHDQPFYNQIREALKATGKWQGEIWNRRKNGAVFIEWIRVNTIFDSSGKVLNRVSLATDITKRKESEDLIWKQANYDELTGLPNRRMFHDRFQQELKKTNRAKLPLALLFIDLDEFKEVNDGLGHALGDLLLKETARRLTNCVRASDTIGKFNNIARLGGDEFTVILSELKDITSVERITQKILETIAEPYTFNEEVVYISASIGITLFPDDASNIDTLLKNADQAMYAAKKLGKNRFSYFTNSMQTSVQNRMQLSKDLRNAIKKQEFHLVYQPIVNLRNNKVQKVEALIRWQHPTKGLISPADFIPIAESTGLIHDIGNWVFKEALEKALEWRKSIDPKFQISINKSPVQVQQNANSANNKHFNWANYMQQHDIPGECIAVEITEGLLLDSNDNIYQHLLGFRDAGIQVALDDFGTGYSSLSYLKKFDIDYIKIDQSFVQNIESDSDNMVLCQAIIVMAHKLKLKVIAEGIETQEQFDLLKFAGCDFGQGYFLSKPLKANALEGFIAKK